MHHDARDARVEVDHGALAGRGDGLAEVGRGIRHGGLRGVLVEVAHGASKIHPSVLEVVGGATQGSKACGVPHKVDLH